MKGTPIKLKFLREFHGSRFRMAKNEVWDCNREWGTGKDYLEAVAQKADWFEFHGGPCPMSIIEETEP